MSTLERKRTKNKHFVDGPAGLLYVDDAGKGGIPVLFIHSFGGSSLHWQKQLEHLRTNRRAVAMDLRGHGQSAAPENNDYEVEVLASDIDAVTDGLKIRRVILVGHSFGASAAIAYAWMHPERVAGLMVMAAPGKSTEEQSKPIITSLESNDYDKVMKEFVGQLLTNARPETSQLEKEGAARLSKQASIKLIKAILTFDPVPALRSYTGPKLIVDTPTEKQPNALSVQMPGVNTIHIEGTSHWAQLDKPEEFNRILDKFIATVDADK